MSNSPAEGEGPSEHSVHVSLAHAVPSAGKSPPWTSIWPAPAPPSIPSSKVTFAMRPSYGELQFLMSHLLGPPTILVCFIFFSIALITF